MIPQIIPLTSETPRLHQPVSRSPVARRNANTLPTQAAQIPMALQHHVVSPHGLPTHLQQTYHIDTTPRLRQRVSRSPVARGHANALSTKAAQIPMALRHHERRVTTRSAQTLEANMSHDSTSDTPRVRQPVSHSPVARRHANALSTKAAQIPHHERRVATRSHT